MKNIISEMLQKPFATAMVVGAIGAAIAGVISAAKGTV